MSNESVALGYALKSGFQIHPAAMDVLKRANPHDLKRVVLNLIRENSKKRVYEISLGDVEAAFGLRDDGPIEAEYRVLFDPTGRTASAEGAEGYAALFASRFHKMRALFSGRPEARSIKPISKVVPVGSASRPELKAFGEAQEAREDAEAYTCGLVTERALDGEAVKLVIEDMSGTMEVTARDEKVREAAEALLLDQFVVVRTVRGRGRTRSAKEIILPDIPDREQARSETDAHAVFVSDLHIGSKLFMEKEFSEFAAWLGSPDPVAKKVRFMLIGGDAVDGVGIYPNQEKELDQQTLGEQMEKLDEMVSLVPAHVEIFVITGNHDPGRRALPQPAIPRAYCGRLADRKNVHLLGNPAMVSLNGVKVLMFHGQSIDDIVKTMPGVSYQQPTKIMRYLLMARHVSPTYGAMTPIAPEAEDMLVMDQVPDVFHTGHVHCMGIERYKNVVMINAGTWQRQTAFQAGVGVEPTPGIAVVLNLRTMQAGEVRFT